jgi:hypothetical protein
MITQNPFIGRSKQSAGGMTATTWKGKNVLKTKPVTVANPKSEGQINQRAKMTTLVGFYQILSAVLMRGFKEMAVGMSEFNAFTSKNLLSSAVSATGGVATFVPANFNISKGSIGVTQIDSISADAGTSQVQITWPAGTIPSNGSVNDKPIAAVYNATKQEWGVYTGSNMRDDGSTNVQMPSNLVSGNAIKVYLGFVSADGRKASNSVYDYATAS